jgi:CHAD domain-containing protein
VPARSSGDGKLTQRLEAVPPAESALTPTPAIVPPVVQNAQAKFPPSGPASPVLEFDISPDEVARLLRSPALTSRRVGRPRTTKVHTIWHDSATGELQASGLALAEQAGAWRLERLVPNGRAEWLPAGPAPVLAQGASPEALPLRLHGPLVPVAAFTGTSRSFALSATADGARIDVLQGDLRGVAHDAPACRVVFAGPAADMAALAQDLAMQANLEVPRAGLAACAVALARGSTPPPRQIGTPHVPPGLTVDEALVLTTAHLADVILYWASLAPEGASPDPVHQMRVAVRRLRSALAVFRRAAPGSAVADLAPALKDLASRLGAARDWDVFLDETGAAVQSAFPGDRRIAAMLAASARRREAAYATLATYLASEAWRRLALSLALVPTVRPWHSTANGVAPAEMLAAPAETYAAQALSRAFKRLLGAGDELSLLPVEALHSVRKQAKKLRYAIEFFAPLFPAKPVRRFVDRLTDLQEALGSLNDAAVAAELMAQLGGGADRAFAAGVVQGYVAASTRPAADAAFRCWRKLARHETFWR